jgi:hypothetical protein
VSVSEWGDSDSVVLGDSSCRKAPVSKFYFFLMNLLAVGSSRATGVSLYYLVRNISKYIRDRRSRKRGDKE